MALAGLPAAVALGYALDQADAEKDRATDDLTRTPSTHRRVRGRIVTGLALVAALAVAAIALRIVSRSRQATHDSFQGIASKSIAVLPFGSLSTNPETAFFADGVQDEILTDLAKIADLKVISRTSVAQYKAGAARNVKAIAAELGVKHLLEGSVQRAGNKVRVNAQLIDATTDAHVWAQTYDRDLADVFVIQSDIAKAIADQLQAKLSPAEKAEIERRPTTDETAYALYTEAKTVLLSAASADPEKDSYLHAIELLDRSVARDPEFFLAYCALVHAHAEIYFYNFDHTPARIGMAEAALQNATRLRPDAGETHLAQAEYLYRCHAKYDRARAELALAARVLPNDSRVFELTGYVDRRQGRWQEAVHNLEKSIALDPRNLVIIQQLGATYPYLRRFDDEANALDRIIALAPKNPGVRISRGFVEVERNADVAPYREAVRAVLAQDPASAEEVAQEWFAVAWYDRDPGEATRAATAIPSNGGGGNAVRFPKAWYMGLAARLRQDTAALASELIKARQEAAQESQKRPDYGPPLCVLGMIDAMLGRDEDAISEGRRAVELLPVEQDSINGSHLLMNLAIIYANTGRKDLAIETIRTLLSKPGDGSYGDFQLNAFWDPLRSERAFQVLVASLHSDR